MSGYKISSWHLPKWVNDDKLKQNTKGLTPEQTQTYTNSKNQSFIAISYQLDNQIRNRPKDNNHNNEAIQRDIKEKLQAFFSATKVINGDSSIIANKQSHNYGKKCIKDLCSIFGMKTGKSDITKLLLYIGSSNFDPQFLNNVPNKKFSPEVKEFLLAINPNIKNEHFGREKTKFLYKTPDLHDLKKRIEQNFQTAHFPKAGFVPEQNIYSPKPIRPDNIRVLNNYLANLANQPSRNSTSSWQTISSNAENDISNNNLRDSNYSLISLSTISENSSTKTIKSNRDSVQSANLSISPYDISTENNQNSPKATNSFSPLSQLQHEFSQIRQSSASFTSVSDYSDYKDYNKNDGMFPNDFATNTKGNPEIEVNTLNRHSNFQIPKSPLYQSQSFESSDALGYFQKVQHTNRHQVVSINMSNMQMPQEVTPIVYSSSLESFQSIQSNKENIPNFLNFSLNIQPLDANQMWEKAIDNLNKKES